MMLELKWDDDTQQYKVNKPGDQSGKYISLEFAQKLAEALVDEITFIEKIGETPSEKSYDILSEALAILQSS